MYAERKKKLENKILGKLQFEVRFSARHLEFR